MRLGCRLVSSTLGLTLVAAPTLTGCGLLDRGSTVEKAFEYVPQDTYKVRFADRGAAAERLGVDDIDPRDISDAELDDYVKALTDEDEVVGTQLSEYVVTMKDAPLNDLDIEWEAYAAWGDDPADPSGEAFVWKVGDDVDFEAFADDLEVKGYDEQRSAGLPVYTVDPADVVADTIGGLYPTVMASLLLDEDDRLVVASYSPDPLGDIADVIADDADSLADGGGMDDLVGAADGDPEYAKLITAGPTLCGTEGRAIFVADEDPKVLLALQYDSEDAARDDLEARQAFIDDGVDSPSARPFDQLGDFDLRQDGELVLIEEDFDGGPQKALQAEDTGGGPGSCLAEAG